MYLRYIESPTSFRDRPKQTTNWVFKKKISMVHGHKPTRTTIVLVHAHLYAIYNSLSCLAK